MRGIDARERNAEWMVRPQMTEERFAAMEKSVQQVSGIVMDYVQVTHPPRLMFKDRRTHGECQV